MFVASNLALSLTKEAQQVVFEMLLDGYLRHLKHPTDPSCAGFISCTSRLGSSRELSVALKSLLSKVRSET
jgi:hypothetical protein